MYEGAIYEGRHYIILLLILDILFGPNSAHQIFSDYAEDGHDWSAAKKIYGPFRTAKVYFVWI